MEELVDDDFENGCSVEDIPAKNSNPANIERNRGNAFGPLLQQILRSCPPTGFIMISIELLSFQNFSIDDNHIHLPIGLSHRNPSLFN
jgi:hypothetical protein